MEARCLSAVLDDDEGAEAERLGFAEGAGVGWGNSRSS